MWAGHHGPALLPSKEEDTFIMSLTLFHAPGTRSVRILWLLEEMGLPYQLRSLAYDSAYFASDAFRAINPMGKLPALHDGDQTIIESAAIMDYLLHRHGPSPLALAPDHHEYATYLQWFHMAESGMATYVATSFGHASGTKPYIVSDAYDDYCRYQVTKALEMLEKQLEDRDYLLKSGFSAADISLGYTLFFALACTGRTYSDRVMNYLGRLMARPALQKALSDLPQDQLVALGLMSDAS